MAQAPVRDDEQHAVHHAHVGPFVAGSRITTRFDQVLAALDASRVGVWEWNVNTGETSFNATWMAMIGYAPQELPHTLSTWEQLVHPDDRAPVTAILQDHLEGRSATYCTVHRLRHKSGHWVWVRDAGVITERTSSGTPLVLIGTHVEVSDLKEIEAELVRARERAEAGERAQARFLGTMSHELRTPMTGILGVIDMLGEAELSSSQRELVELLGGAARQLHHLLDDALEIARLDAGAVRIERAPLCWRTLLSELLELYRRAAAARGVSLRLLDDGVDDGVDEGAEHLAVFGDAMRLRQIVGNLVHNAIRFTRADTEVCVRLHAEVAHDDVEAVRVLVHVDDQGPGVADDARESIFERFRQASSSPASGGFGLGLAIARELARAMGGDVTLARTSSAGASFCLQLTQPRAPHLDVEAVRARPPAPSWQRAPVVLVAEDVELNRVVLGRMLEALGCEVHAVHNGAQAVELVPTLQPDCVWMDWEMPVLDGLAATRALRERGFRAPIFGVTAHAQPEDERHVRAAGMDARLHKPFQPAQLRALLVQHLAALLRA